MEYERSKLRYAKSAQLLTCSILKGYRETLHIFSIDHWARDGGPTFGHLHVGDILPFIHRDKPLVTSSPAASGKYVGRRWKRISGRYT